MAAFDDRSGVVRLNPIPLALAGEKPVVIDRDGQGKSFMPSSFSRGFAQLARLHQFAGIFSNWVIYTKRLSGSSRLLRTGKRSR